MLPSDTDPEAPKDEHDGWWKRLSKWAGRANSLRLVFVLMTGIFAGGFVSAKAVEGYATKTFVESTISKGHAHEATAVKIADLENRMTRLEVGLSVNVAWIKESIRSIASRSGIRLPEDPPPIVPK